eukprot:CAMPEP_0170588620 /NCGR_PEP_ID=MMETSP0224-20130122/10929_1 /TAXON_ID=285029 /ORGANISM="Togula jolla, Strain CCCM 725" /LENGTH=51 /DNA_ID=CAMNT_0010912353 /DNA_START=312 /DNA_END=467 /DNA_ORIENTATION=-
MGEVKLGPQRWSALHARGPEDCTKRWETTPDIGNPLQTPSFAAQSGGSSRL